MSRAKKQGNPDPIPTATKQDFLDVGIGASAGGIQALKTFFANVPKDSGNVYVVILHLSPEYESHLAQVLQAFGLDRFEASERDILWGAALAIAPET